MSQLGRLIELSTLGHLLQERLTSISRRRQIELDSGAARAELSPAAACCWLLAARAPSKGSFDALASGIKWSPPPPIERIKAALWSAQFFPFVSLFFHSQLFRTNCNSTAASNKRLPTVFVVVRDLDC